MSPLVPFPWNDPRRACEPYQPCPDALWNATRVAHLRRRAGLGATWGQLQRELAEAYRPQSAGAWLDAMAVLLAGATISSESKDGLLTLVRSESDPARLHGRILTRMLSLPEGQVG